MRYPEQSLTENEERWGGGERKSSKGGKVRGMNLYHEETKEEIRGKKKYDLAYIYILAYLCEK